MAKRIVHSRWRRLSNVSRFHENKRPDPKLEDQRLILYLPSGVIDRAESQSIRGGFSTVQAYCESLLSAAIDSKHDRERVEEIEARHGTLEGLHAIADDPEYLAELSASNIARDRPPRAEPVAISPPPPSWELLDAAPSSGATHTESEEVVLRHAAVGSNDPAAFLPTLRRGEPVNAHIAQELLHAMTVLEVEQRDAPRLDRRLAYALHRLAFEGQVLLTDAWPGSVADEGTVDVLRLVQEAVDRILSGEDIRYFSQGYGPADAS